MNDVDFGKVDVVTILDALHYFDHALQRRVLERIRDAVGPGGLFITRVGDASAGLPFKLSNWVDHLVTFSRGLNGVSNIFNIQYQLTRRLSVQAQTGTENAIDLFYTFEFR